MPLVNVTIPVLNEEIQLASSIGKLFEFLRKRCRFEFEIVIADNGSTDRTWAIAQDLCLRYPCVRDLHIQEKGRGRALKQAWSQSSADVLSYMDVDLSTDLWAFAPMIEAVLSGGFDIATGSRLLKSKLTTRSYKREIISRAYNVLVRSLFRAGFTDAQCGFKAIHREAATSLLPLIDDTGWFFDTELLIVGEKLGYRIFDLPVRWVEDADSRVKILKTGIGCFKGLLRVRRDALKGKYTRAGVL